MKADKSEGEEATADKKKKSKKAEKKEEAPKESCIQGFYVEAEQEVAEDEEELECEEYEYEGETYGLASNGDLYTQDGELVGKVENGVPTFN